MRLTILQIITDTTKMITNTKPDADPTNNSWMWVAVSEFAVIGYLAFKLFKRKRISFNTVEGESLSDAKNSNVDMDNLMNSINKSRQLYKQLSAKCHPDRFVSDEEKKVIAESLFQDITRNQRNYNKLLELQEEATQKLNITF